MKTDPVNKWMVLNIWIQDQRLPIEFPGCYTRMKHKNTTGEDMEKQPGEGKLNEENAFAEVNYEIVSNKY